MRRFLLIAIAVFICSVSFGQVVNIPDPELKRTLTTLPTYSSTGGNVPDTVIDTNSDGEIQVSETIGITNLFIEDRINFQTILVNDITGLEEFNDLQHLSINVVNSGTVVSFSQIRSLVELNLGDDSSVYTLHLVGMPSLVSASLNAASITNLLIENNPTLTSVSGVENQGADYQFINCPLMEDITVADYRGTSIVLDDLPNLTRLAFPHTANASAQSGQLQRIDLSDLPQLEQLRMETQLEIDSLDFSNNPLISLVRFQNPTTTDAKLQYVNFKNGGSNLTSLDFSSRSDLGFVCTDSSERNFVEVQLFNQGFPNVYVTDNCASFPGFANTVSGITSFDINGNCSP